MSRVGEAMTDRRAEFEREALPYLGDLRGAALRLVRDEGEAEDLVQETYLKAYSRFGQYRAGTNCRAWLLRILRNLFINGYRRRAKEREILDAHASEDPAERFFSAPSQRRYADPEERLSFHSLGRELQEALDELPEHFRRVVVLSDVCDLSYREIASTMGTPVGTVMSRLSRGRRSLRDRLRRYAIHSGVVAETAEEPRLELAS